MSNPQKCFLIMPFRPEFTYFHLYIKKYLLEKYGLIVERGDNDILTKPIMEKIRDQIIKADIIIADISYGNPNVFYEIGLAHAFGKAVIFLTQDEPKDAPVDVRQFEFIQYAFQNHIAFSNKLDNAISNILKNKNEKYYEKALLLLKKFNTETKSTYCAASIDDFSAKVVRGEQIYGSPSETNEKQMAEFFLPKIITESSDYVVMKKVMDWIGVD